MSKIVTVLDLGSANFKGIVASEEKDGNFEIIHVFKQPSFGIRKGMIENFDDPLELLYNIFNDLKKISKKATQNIFVNIQSEYVRSRILKGTTAVFSTNKEITWEDIKNARENSLASRINENYKIIKIIPNEYIVDDVRGIVDPLEVSGSKLEVENFIVEVPTPHLEQLLKLFKLAGFHLVEENFIFNPLAAAEAVLTKRQKNLGVLLVDFGYSTMSFVVYEEGKILYAKTLPVGSFDITKDISSGFKIGIDAAEKIKVNFSKVKSNETKKRELNIKFTDLGLEKEGEISKKFLFEIIEARLTDILKSLTDEVKKIGKILSLPGGVVVTGGGSKLFNLEEILKDKLHLPVQIGIPNLNQIEVFNPTHSNLLEDPEFAVAVGLLLFSKKQEIAPSYKKTKSIKWFFKNYFTP
jgi:cell division protein FtsA